MHCKVFIVIPSDIYYAGVEAIEEYVCTMMNSKQFITHIDYPYSFDGYTFGGRQDGLMIIYDNDSGFDSEEYYQKLKKQEKTLDNCNRIDRFLEFFTQENNDPHHTEYVRDLFTLDQHICTYDYEDFISELEKIPHEYIAYIDYHC